PTVLAGIAIQAGGDATQTAHWLPRLADGSVRATLALLEESGRWDPAAFTAKLESGRDGAMLSGTKRFVPEADRADVIVCAARRDDGAVALALVERGGPGLAITPLASLDPTRRIADVTFDRVPVSAAHVLSGDGAAALARLLDCGRIALAADMSGGAERTL